MCSKIKSDTHTHRFTLTRKPHCTWKRKPPARTKLKKKCTRKISANFKSHLIQTTTKTNHIYLHTTHLRVNESYSFVLWKSLVSGTLIGINKNSTFPQLWLDFFFFFLLVQSGWMFAGRSDSHCVVVETECVCVRHTLSELQQRFVVS